MSVTIWLDADDRIVDVNDEFESFADANEAPGLDRDAVIGHSMYEYVQGEATREALNVLLEQVRHQERMSSLTYRCDSPGLRRYMQMMILPESHGNLRLDHVLVEETAEEPAVHFHTGGDHPVARCSICNAVNLGGRWMEAATARTEGLIGLDASVEYRVCPSCHRRIFD